MYEGPTVKKLTSATWNYDGTCLATCATAKPDHITLTHAKNVRSVCTYDLFFSIVWEREVAKIYIYVDVFFFFVTFC